MNLPVSIEKLFTSFYDLCYNHCSFVARTNNVNVLIARVIDKRCEWEKTISVISISNQLKTNRIDEANLILTLSNFSENFSSVIWQIHLLDETGQHVHVRLVQRICICTCCKRRCTFQQTHLLLRSLHVSPVIVINRRWCLIKIDLFEFINVTSDLQP